MAKLEKVLRIRAGKPLAVILGSTITGLTIVRSLARRNVPTLQIDSDKNEAMHTRYGESHLLPRLEQCPGEWLGFLESVGKRLEEPGVIFPTSDAHLLFLSRNRQDIGRFFRFIIPGPEAVEQLVNKRSQYTLAERAGVAVPNTLYPESTADVRSWAADLAYPCILKPYSYVERGMIGTNLLLAKSPSELIETFGRLSDKGFEFMIQELIPGDATTSVAYHGFWDAEGKERAWWIRQHVRRNPFGSGSIMVTADVPALATLSRRVLAAFDYCGLSNVQSKLDVRHNKYYLMEINARPGQSLQLGVSAGIDLPWISYSHLSRISTETELTLKPGVMYMDEKMDLELWSSGGIRLSSWLRSFIRVKSKAYWRWNDPGPFIVLMWNSGGAWLRRSVVALFFHLPMMAGILNTLSRLSRKQGSHASAERLSSLALKCRERRVMNHSPGLVESSSTNSRMHV